MGEPELAEAWRHSQDEAAPSAAGGPPLPGDVRHRVLDRLAASGDLADLLRPPDRDGLVGTLARLGYDALVYLIPQGRGEAARPGAGRSSGWAADRPGGALTVTASGRVGWGDLPDLAVGPDSAVGGYLRAHHALLTPGGARDQRDAWRDALEHACQWAWAAAMEPLTPVLAHIHPARRARVVFVPVDALCVIPWHAAYPASDHGLPPGERRYAMDAVTISYAASGALLSRVARRSPPALSASVLLIGDPAGDLPHARAETQALRAAFYPDATVWGRPPSMTDGEAAAPRLRTALQGAGHSLFHYAGHATVDVAKPGSALVMGDQRLRAEQISRLTPGESYCVSLSACTTHLATDAFDEVFTLSTAFLLGGASTVLGSLWRLKDSVGTAVLMFLLHHYLSRGTRPVDALRRAQRWMLDPGRRIPASMPGQLREAIPGVDLTDPVTWAGITHQGH
jgi:CHAT domain